MRKFIFKFLAVLGMCLLFPTLAVAEKPGVILDKTVAKLNNATSVNCKFRIVSSGNKINGVFKSTGKKFHLDTPVAKTWYDGKNMWTSNPRSKEITLVNPSAQEVNEVNPFAYMNSYKSKYNVGYSRRTDDARHLIVLNPKGKNDDIKAVEIAVNKKTLLPERFIIRDRNDHITTVYIEALVTDTNNGGNTFVCPVSSYGDYEIVDLR